ICYHVWNTHQMAVLRLSASDYNLKSRLPAGARLRALSACNSCPPVLWRVLLREERRDMKTGLQIASEAHFEPIAAIAERAGIPAEFVEQHGRYKAKINLDVLEALRERPL